MNFMDLMKKLLLLDMSSLSLDSVSQLTVSGTALGTTFGDIFGDNFYGPNEKVIVVGYFVPVVETHLSADGRPHWLRMDIPFIDQFSEKTPWSAKSNYPNYFFSLGDHNSKFFFHCLSSHFDYTIKVSHGN